MNRLAVFVLPLMCTFLLTTCKKKENAHDQELAERIKQFEAVRDKPLTRKEEREKEMNRLTKELTRSYPGALPIGKDSAEKIIYNPLPDTVGIYQKIDRYTVLKSPKAEMPFDSAFTYPKKEYLIGVASYGLRKGKKFIPRRGNTTIVRDIGYTTEWFSMVMANQVLAGKNQAGYDLFMRSHRFEKVTEHLGQKWAVWYDPTLTRPRHTGSRVFITFWNHRFAVLAITTDTAKHTPDFVGKILDVEWLKQLKYPQ